MAVRSYSAREFMRRQGLQETPVTPTPRQDFTELRIHQIPLEKRQLDPAQMLDTSGSPSPDRGRTDDWPPQQEVTDNGSINEQQ